MKRLLLLTLVGLCAGGALHAAPHQLDQSYIYLSIYDDSMSGRFEITTRDLNRALGLDLPTDRPVTVAELAPIRDALEAYLLDHFSLASNDTPYRLRFTDLEVMDLEMADFVLLSFDLEGVTDIPDYLDVTYDVLFDVDPQHRGLLHIEHNWRTGTFNNESIPSLEFAPGRTTAQLDLTDSLVWKGFMIMVRQGIWHIWIGIDHILFLIALLLPSVVRREAGAWVPVENFKSALWYVVKIVTVFTIAHSITLSLASLEIVTLPSRLVESIIALSIIAVALHNLYPTVLPGKDWVIVFVFGLFHGFGFASVLGELGAGSDFLLLTLLGFNLGVEIGQVAVVAAAFPILYLIRKPQPVYRRVLAYGSVFLILVAGYWFVERAFDVDLPAGRIAKSVLGINGEA